MSSWIDRMDVGVHVGITGFFYRASEHRIFFFRVGNEHSHVRDAKRVTSRIQKESKSPAGRW